MDLAEEPSSAPLLQPSEAAKDERLLVDAEEMARLAYIEEFASAATFDITYSGEVDFRMYERVCRLAEFMWVARRYSERGFDGGSA